MKQLFKLLVGGMIMMAMPLMLTSCEGEFDDIFGEWSRPTGTNNDKSDKPEPLTVSAEGFNNIYDGNAHGITVTAPEGATIKYGTAEGSYTLDASPTFTNASKNTVYYQVTKDKYTPFAGSADVIISKAEGTISFTTATVELMNTETTYTQTATLTGDGSISGYSSSVPGVATVDGDGKVTIVGAGTTIITATATDGTNYKYPTNTTTYTLTVKPSGLGKPSTYGSGTNPF